jgi:hypothetical protein
MWSNIVSTMREGSYFVKSMIYVLVVTYAGGPD